MFQVQEALADYYQGYWIIQAERNSDSGSHLVQCPGGAGNAARAAHSLCPQLVREMSGRSSQVCWTCIS